MMHETEAGHEVVLHTKQLQQLMPVIIGLVALFFVSYTILYVTSGMSAFLVAAAGFLIATISVLIARSFVLQNRLLPAVWLLGIGLLGALVISVVAFPFAYATAMFGLITVVLIVLAHLQGRLLIGFLLLSWLFALAILLIGNFVRLFAEPSQIYQQIMTLFGSMASIAVSLWLLWQYHKRLSSALTQALGSNDSLRAIQANLETQVTERTAALQSALDTLEANASAQAQLSEELALKNEVIRELSIPVLPISDDTLVMPLVGALDSTRLLQVQEQALRSIEQSRAHRLLLDITGVPVVDSQVAQGLISVVQSARLLGADVVLVGIRPEVAQAMVQLGLDLQGITTHSQLQQGIALV
jgi:rsbT co-antagonist protein RsbR